MKSGSRDCDVICNLAVSQAWNSRAPVCLAGLEGDAWLT
jgi:hypothetical protein